MYVNQKRKNNSGLVFQLLVFMKCPYSPKSVPVQLVRTLTAWIRKKDVKWVSIWFVNQFYWSAKLLTVTLAASATANRFSVWCLHAFICHSVFFFVFCETAGWTITQRPQTISARATVVNTKVSKRQSRHKLPNIFPGRKEKNMHSFLRVCERVCVPQEHTQFLATSTQYRKMRG